MVLKPEDFERLKKNVHAMNSGSAKVGDHVHGMHERSESGAQERMENNTQAGTALYKRFYGHGKP